MRLYYLALAAFVVLGGAARYHPANDPAKPEPPKRWRVNIPYWHPSRANERIGERERHYRLEYDRRIVAKAFEDIAEPKGNVTRKVNVMIVLKRRQHTPPENGYWDAITDALDMCGQGSQLQRGSVRFERAQNDYYGTTIEVVEESR